MTTQGVPMTVPASCVPVRAGKDARDPGEYSHNLDLLRALAVCCVVVSHLLIEHSIRAIGSFHVQSLGTLGVMIFFVHTCLVLMQSLARQRAAERHGPGPGLGFLVMRAFRIYPMSVLVVLVLGVMGQFSPAGSPSLSTFLSNIFLVQNLTGAPSITPVLWSLPYEVQMYLFLPGLFALAHLAGQNAWRWMLVLWCGAVIVVLLFWKLGLNHDLVKFFPCFLPGVLAYCLRQAPKPWSASILFLFVFTGAILFPCLVGMGGSATILSWVFCLALGALIPRCRELRSPSLAWCGKMLARYSYGIYLVHVPILYLCFRDLGALPALIRWTLFLAGVATVSGLAYHFIEKPGIAYGRALARRVGARRRQPAPSA